MVQRRRTQSKFGVTTILHVPHSSTHIPAETRDALLLDDDGLALELMKMTDHHTVELFTGGLASGHKAIIFPVSRLVVDVERFEDDSDEPMSEQGMGVIYTTTSDLKPLRNPPRPAEREALLARFYRPHHRQLERLVDKGLARDGNRVFVLDCRSFPSRPLPYEDDQALPRPDFRIGTHSFHTPEGLGEGLVQWIESMGYSAALHTSFAGAFVPRRHYESEKRVVALMIEVNRGLYMDEASGTKSARFDEVRQLLVRLVGLLVQGMKGGHSLRAICREYGQYLAGHRAGFQADAADGTKFEIYEIFERVLCLARDADGREYVEFHDDFERALRNFDPFYVVAMEGDAVLDPSVRSRRMSENAIAEYQLALGGLIDEWIGFDIPDEGTEDYSTWTGLLMDVDEIRTFGDVIDFPLSGDDEAAALAGGLTATVLARQGGITWPFGEG